MRGTHEIRSNHNIYHQTHRVCLSFDVQRSDSQRVDKSAPHYNVAGMKISLSVKMIYSYWLHDAVTDVEVKL